MVEFNKKKSYKKFTHSPYTLFFLFIIFLILLKAVWGVYQKEQTSSHYLSQTQKDLDKLSARQKTLAQSVESLKTEKGIEQEIRNKFRLVKGGESIAVIVDDETPISQPVATSSPTFWEDFLDRIGL